MPDMAPYIKDEFNYKIYYQCIPLKKNDPIEKLDILTVAHSPGLKKENDHKGTSVIQKVCNNLGLNLDVISGVSWEESVKRKQKAHIFIDQFITEKTRKDLKIDSPYNTYFYAGLPPTPIALPGVEAIHAALHPEAGDSYYFVAKGDGSHHFSKTLKEHNRAVAKYQLGK